MSTSSTSIAREIQPRLGNRLLLLLAVLLLGLWGFSALKPYPPLEGPPEELFVQVKTIGSAATVEIPGLDHELAQQGEEAFKRNGCYACHSVTGAVLVGPSLLAIYGAEQPLDDGTSVVADDDYIRESIVEPHAKIVKGFPASMPLYGQLLSDDDVTALVEYVKSLH
jgi:cytochrome c oxidase subunit 2